MTPDLDYPAAHSMDTVWFAVDADGHVAMFASGNIGAVPQQASAVGAGIEENDCGFLDLLDTLPATGGRHDAAACGPPGEDVRHSTWERAGSLRLCFLRVPEPGSNGLTGREPMRPLGIDASPTAPVPAEPRDPALPGNAAGVAPVGGPAGVGRVLETLHAVQTAVAAGEAAVVPAVGSAAVILRCGSPALRLIHEAGLCRGCVDHHPSQWPPEPEPGLAPFGFFDYSHVWESDDLCGVYGRAHVPDNPVRLEELPAEIRGPLSRGTRFDSLCFATSPFVQPLEHGPCRTWYAEYAFRRADGAIVVVPGPSR